ncbi:hypothetical protein GBF38_005657, partial [Nibea albiflora]
FLSNVHLENKMDTSSYLDKALQCMTFPPLSHLDSESDDSCSNTKTDTSGKMDSSYEKSDPQAMEADSNIEPSSASLSEIFTENSHASDADIESFYDDNSGSEDYSSEDEDRCLDIESYICEESLTDSLSGYDADMENNSKSVSVVESSIDGDPHTRGNNTDECSVDDDHIPPTRRTCFDNPCFTDEDDIKPVSSYSSDGDNTKTTDPTEASLHIDETCSEKRPSTPLFCGENLPQVGHNVQQAIINEETFTNELQAEKNKNKLLQEELERLCVSYQLLIARYEDDALKSREQADALQRDLDSEILQKNRLQSEFVKATAALQEDREKNKTLQGQLDKTTVSLYEVNLSYQTDITVRQQADTLRSDLERELKQNKLLQTSYEELHEAHKRNQEKFRRRYEREVLQKITGRDDNCEDEPSKQQESIPNAVPLEPTKEAEVPEEMLCKQQETISPAPALESQREAERNLPQRTAEPPSAWKRVRHFLGLRKPKRMAQEKNRLVAQGMKFKTCKNNKENFMHPD